MKNTRISIIVPIFNAEQFLPKCIESIQNQTYKDLEIILVNDGSTDNSLNLCYDYAKKDKRIIVIDKNNGGVSSARNAGLDNATGAYIGFVDSDDYIDVSMYKKLFESIIEHDADIAECGYIAEDFVGNKSTKMELRESITNGSYNCSYEYLASKNTFNFNWNKIYKKSLFNEIRYPELSYSEDYVVNVKVFYKCTKKVTISGCYYHYLINDEGACRKPFTVKKLDMIKAGQMMISYHEERYPDLVPYIRVYLLSKILMIYKDIMGSKQKSDNYLILIRNEFINQYNLLSEKPINKIYIKFWLYCKFPKLYFWLEKNIFGKKIK